MKSNKSLQIILIVACFVAGVITFYLALQAVRRPSILGENPPSPVFFNSLLIFFFTTGGILAGKYFARKEDE